MAEPVKSSRNHKVTIVMSPFGSAKALPELGFVFPCSATRTVVCSAEDAAEFERLSKMVHIDPHTKQSRPCSRFTLVTDVETDDALTPKIPHFGWTKQVIKKHPAVEAAEIQAQAQEKTMVLIGQLVERLAANSNRQQQSR